jgi:hypothetical protein
MSKFSALLLALIVVSLSGLAASGVRFFLGKLPTQIAHPETFSLLVILTVVLAEDSFRTIGAIIIKKIANVEVIYPVFFIAIFFFIFEVTIISIALKSAGIDGALLIVILAFFSFSRISIHFIMGAVYTYSLIKGGWLFIASTLALHFLSNASAFYMTDFELDLDIYYPLFVAREILVLILFLALFRFSQMLAIVDWKPDVFHRQ